jgi:hypothetical protein
LRSSQTDTERDPLEVSSQSTHLRKNDLKKDYSMDSE